VAAGWVTADEVYGGDARLRAFLEDRDLAYVLAVKATQPLWVAGEQGPAEVAARELVARLPARAWRRLSAGDGAKGPRVYDWARVALTRPGWPGRGFWLLARRRLSDGELAFYACFGPARTSLAEPGPLPGPPLRRLVPARHPDHDRPGVSGGGPRPGRHLQSGGRGGRLSAQNCHSHPGRT
jgi:hypothetical protein